MVLTQPERKGPLRPHQPGAVTAGYVRVWGPSSDPNRPNDCYLIIEQYNGAVAVRQEIAQHLAGVVARPHGVNIRTDPVGFSCGRDYGKFGNAIPPSAMGPGCTYSTSANLVQAIIGAFSAERIPW